MRPIRLSDGTELPAGTKILMPLAGVSRDERLYSSPETFDAFRFYRLREAQEQEQLRLRRHQQRWQELEQHQSPPPSSFSAPSSSRPPSPSSLSDLSASSYGTDYSPLTSEDDGEDRPPSRKDRAPTATAAAGSGGGNRWQLTSLTDGSGNFGA